MSSINRANLQTALIDLSSFFLHLLSFSRAKFVVPFDLLGIFKVWFLAIQREYLLNSCFQQEGSITTALCVIYFFLRFRSFCLYNRRLLKRKSFTQLVYLARRFCSLIELLSIYVECEGEQLILPLSRHIALALSPNIAI